MEEKVSKIAFRQDSAENWLLTNPILDAGEPGYEINENGINKWKLGDGITAWKDLKYQNGTSEQIEVEQDEINSISFDAAYPETTIINGEWKYTTQNNPEERIVSGSIALPTQTVPEQKNIVNSEDIIVKEIDTNNITLEFTEQFKKDFNYLNRQSQVFVEDCNDFTSFKEALTEFQNTDGLDILGFKVKVLQDCAFNMLNNYAFVREGEKVTLTNTPSVVKVLSNADEITTFSYNYNPTENKYILYIEDTAQPVSISFVNKENTVVLINAKPIIEVSGTGNLTFGAVAGYGHGPAELKEANVEGHHIDDYLKFSIIGIDKSGVMKK